MHSPKALPYETLGWQQDMYLSAKGPMKKRLMARSAAL